MSLLPQDEIGQQIEEGREAIKNLLQFVQDQDFYERLVENPDWLRAKEDLTKELKLLKTTRDEALDTLVKTRGSVKVDIQDGILECQIRIDQFNLFMGWFENKVKALKQARESIPQIKEKLTKLQEELHG